MCVEGTQAQLLPALAVHDMIWFSQTRPPDPTIKVRAFGQLIGEIGPDALRASWRGNYSRDFPNRSTTPRTAADRKLLGPPRVGSGFSRSTYGRGGSRSSRMRPCCGPAACVAGFSRCRIW